MTGVQHFINRAYGESAAYQWVREAYINADEAQATTVYFGVEWQAARSKGVYRRLIADNGISIASDELPKFFNTFGGSGKPIGDVHENFGVGFKTSVLPWNTYGVAVIAYQDGEAAMIWVHRDPKTGEYGLRIEEVLDENGEISLESVYEPYDDPEHGCNWAEVWPWPDKPRQGVVIVLMGDGPDSDTFLGDVTREEGKIDAIPRFLNGRIWQIPDNHQVTALDFKRMEKTEWGVGDSQYGPEGARRWQNRNIYGQKYYLEKVDEHVDSGVVEVDGGRAKILWYLHPEGTTEYVTVAHQTGFVATLYKNELYDRSTHHAAFWPFGVTEPLVRKRVSLIVVPTEFDKQAGYGAYPNSTRSTLLYADGAARAGDLPIREWASEFADKMPQEIIDGIRAQRAKQSGTITDEAWRKKLADRFGARWRSPRLRVSIDGSIRGIVVQSGDQPRTVRTKLKIKRRRGRSRTRTGLGGIPAIGVADPEGDVKLKQRKVGVALPEFDLRRSDSFSPGMLALWSPKEPGYPNGCVLINADHPVISEEILEWQKQYPQAHADVVAKEVAEAYGQVAVAHIAHSEHLRGVVSSDKIDNDLRSEEALTMALLGLWPLEAIIRARLAAKFPRVA
ncbi:MAG: hypothetical protein DLM53_12825 [Candidatus Eremiobacter antarcticus]|nr:MAG: hypothetical protein DLM53_12825 [Candidatus Eremiobacter sp. RRmetagenome_bin22]